MVLCLLVVAGAADQHGPLSTDARDLVCGPRCIQHILERYGVREDLYRLIQEIQWPNLESGASLLALDESLKRRGLYTRRLVLRPGAALNWPMPVLVHVETTTGRGHYFVCVRAGHGQALVWDGVFPLPGEQLQKHWSSGTRTVLLTAPEAISDRDVSRAVQGELGWITFALLGVADCSLLFLLLCARERRLGNAPNSLSKSTFWRAIRSMCWVSQIIPL